MTNILIVLGHPDPDDGHLCHTITDAYETRAPDNRHSAEKNEIAQEAIPHIIPSVDWESIGLPALAQKGRAAVVGAQHIVRIHPLWMGDIPTMLKA
jgi:putative NADPH-quinone reductase